MQGRAVQKNVSRLWDVPRSIDREQATRYVCHSSSVLQLGCREQNPWQSRGISASFNDANTGHKTNYVAVKKNVYSGISALAVLPKKYRVHDCVVVLTKKNGTYVARQDKALVKRVVARVRRLSMLTTYPN